MSPDQDAAVLVIDRTEKILPSWTFRKAVFWRYGCIQGPNGKRGIKVLLEWYLGVLDGIAEEFDLKSFDNLFIRFMVAVFIVAIVVIIFMAVVHIVGRELAHSMTSIGKQLAKGARTDSIRTIERLSAKISEGLRRAAFPMLQGHPTNENQKRETLPCTTQNTWQNIVRLLMRLLVLCIHMLIIAFHRMGRLMLTLFGLVVIVLAVSMALPDLVRALDVLIKDSVNNLLTAVASPGALIATTAASVAIIVVVAKLWRSDRVLSAREFRRQRDIEALELLIEFLPVARRVADAIDDHIERTVVFFEFERSHLQRWKAALNGKPSRRLSRYEEIDHEFCTSECLNVIKKTAPEATYLPDVEKALATWDQTRPLRSAMFEHQREFARLFRWSLRARESYREIIVFSLRMGMGCPSTKRKFSLPAINEWREH